MKNTSSPKLYFLLSTAFLTSAPDRRARSPRSFNTLWVAQNQDFFPNIFHLLMSQGTRARRVTVMCVPYKSCSVSFFDLRKILPNDYRPIEKNCERALARSPAAFWKGMYRPHVRQEAVPLWHRGSSLFCSRSMWSPYLKTFPPFPFCLEVREQSPKPLLWYTSQSIAKALISIWGLQSKTLRRKIFLCSFGGARGSTNWTDESVVLCAVRAWSQKSPLDWILTAEVKSLRIFLASCSQKYQETCLVH